jgi:hypothetical protein
VCGRTKARPTHYFPVYGTALLIRPVFIWQIYGPNSLILAKNGYEVRSPMSNE